MPLPIIDPAHYETQLAAKLQTLRADFAALDTPAPEIFRSAPLHYRLRAEFRIWKNAGTIDYVMFDPDAPQQPIALTQFPAGSQRINTLMPQLRDYLSGDEILRHRLYAVEFLTTLSGDALITLIYHKPLNDEWQAAALRLRATLGVDLIGRSRGKKIPLDRDWVQETLRVAGRDWNYRQIEGSFTQPNGGTNQHMLEWTCTQARALSPNRSLSNNGGGDLLELYCGNGNFTLPLSQHFGKVLATEVSKTSIAAAQHNLAVNHVENVSMARLSSDEISTALSGGRAFRRLSAIDLTSYDFSTLLVDPPRMGLDPVTLKLAERFENILYISCNPQTLRDNLIVLQENHRIKAFAVFDQFPYTHHLECGVLLAR
ncbi:MAG: tRNA (uridine(54)-C5)-methyltransferase TrmA, partial [Spongiibacteraceae bacterium]